MICLRLDFLFVSYQFTIVSLYFIALYPSCISINRWCQIFYPYRSTIPNSEVTETGQNFFPRNQMKFQLRVKRMTNRRSSHPARSTKIRWQPSPKVSTDGNLSGIRSVRSFIVARTSHLASACTHASALGKLLKSTSEEPNLERNENSPLERGRKTKNKNIEKKKLKIKRIDI